MKLYLDVQISSGHFRRFDFLNCSDFSEIFIDNLFCVYCYKIHNHCYFFKGFIYSTRYIFTSSFYRSKKELYCAVQNFLQQFL